MLIKYLRIRLGFINSCRFTVGSKGLYMASLNIKLAMVDLSGTLHIDDEVTPDAQSSLNKLRCCRAKVKFVTNTTKESKKALIRRLDRLGFGIKPEEIFSSLTAAHDLIIKEKLKPYLLVDDCAIEDFCDVISFDGEPNAVVVGLAQAKFNFKNLNYAFRLLMNGARFIAIHEGRFYRSKTGLALGPGPFVRILEYASGRKATIVGKPSSEFFLAALDGFNPNEAVMIGDDMRDDVAGAQKVGIYGVLVKTGKYRPNDENSLTKQPDMVADNFSEAVAKLLGHMDS